MCVQITIQTSEAENFNLNKIFRMKGAKNELSTGLTSGHYTAAVYCKQRNTFYYCNDETISEIESLVDGDYTSTVYMIVYERQ